MEHVLICFLSESICELPYLSYYKVVVTWFINDNDTSIHNTMPENGSSNMCIEFLLQEVKKQPPVTLVVKGNGWEQNLRVLAAYSAHTWDRFQQGQNFKRTQAQVGKRSRNSFG